MQFQYIAHINAYRHRPKTSVQFAPILLAAGIQAPALSAKSIHRMRARANGHAAAAAAKSRPRSEAQRAYNRSRGTVAEKIVKQEVQDILARYRWLGAVRG